MGSANAVPDGQVIQEIQLRECVRGRVLRDDAHPRRLHEAYVCPAKDALGYRSGRKLRRGPHWT